VSALAFLTVDTVTGGEDGKRVAVARSPMERRAVAAGAVLERRSGWNVAVRYGEDPSVERIRLTETVGFADRSQLPSFELHGAHGLALGTAARREGAWWCPVTPARALALGGPRPEGTVVEMTSGLAAIALVGPGWRELLARFCAIDPREGSLPVAAFRPGSVARIPGYVLREAPERLLVLCGWALGEYLWEVVADAAEHLGGGPVGADALDA
jgi:glycine cleavage system aminomethyltransferase T